MKIKLLSLCCLSIASFFGQTPITINFSDVPVVGSQFVNIRNLDFTGINVGNPGANQVYDFSGFQNFGEDSMFYINASETVYPTSFPNSNMVSFNGTDSSLVFFNSTNTQLTVNGLLMNIPFLGVGLVTASDPVIEFNLPMNYNDTLSDVSNLSTSSLPFYQTVPGVGYFDSVRAQVLRTRGAKIDGWGTLVTPFGLSFQVLRYKAIDITTVTPEANMYLQDTILGTPFEIPLGYQVLPGTEFSDTATTYYYYTNSNSTTPMILAEIAQNNQGITTNAKYAKFNFVSTSISELNDSQYISISPNPANNFVNVNSEVEINSIKLIALDGKEIVSKRINAKNITLDLSNYRTGIYTLIIQTEKGEEIKKINKL